MFDNESLAEFILKYYESPELPMILTELIVVIVSLAPIHVRFRVT